MRLIIAIASFTFVLLCSGCAGEKPSAPAAGSASTPTPAAGTAPQAPAPVALPKGELTPKGPVGLFFMTRYWSGGTLEKAAWYFTANGDVYQNLESGITAEDLAAHKGPKGTYKFDGKNLEVTWADGKKTSSELDPDKETFMWEMGIFSPAKPIESSASIVGNYEGGESLNRDGNAAAVSKTLILNADGTYSHESVAALKGETATGSIAASSQGTTLGKWTVQGYTLTFTSNDGKTAKKIAFPYDDGKHFRLYVGGIMYKRQK